MHKAGLSICFCPSVSQCVSHQNFRLINEASIPCLAYCDLKSATCTTVPHLLKLKLSPLPSPPLPSPPVSSLHSDQYSTRDNDSCSVCTSDTYLTFEDSLVRAPISTSPVRIAGEISCPHFLTAQSPEESLGVLTKAWE